MREFYHISCIALAFWYIRRRLGSYMISQWVHIIGEKDLGIHELVC